MRKPNAAQQRALNDIGKWSDVLTVGSKNLLVVMRHAHDKLGMSYRAIGKRAGYSDVAVRDALNAKKPIDGLPRRNGRVP